MYGFCELEPSSQAGLYRLHSRTRLDGTMADVCYTIRRHLITGAWESLTSFPGQDIEHGGAEAYSYTLRGAVLQCYALRDEGYDFTE